MLIAATPPAIAQAPAGRALDAADMRRWAAQGFDADAARSWTSVGIGPDEARRWREGGIEFAEWANQWKGEGFTAQEAGAWARARVNVYTAGDFRDAGFGISEATAWIDRGVRSALRAGEFRDRGFTPAEAGEWWRREFFPKDAAEWRKAGMGAAEALEWKYGEKEYAYPGGSKIWWRDVYAVEWARPWKSAGFTAAEARRAHEYDVSFAEASAWRTSGFAFEEGIAWKDSGFGPEEAARMKAAGLGPVEAEERQNSYSEADVVTSFHSEVVLRPDASVDVTETIVVSNGPAGPLERCFSRTFPAFVTLRRSRSSSDSGFPTYRLASVLHNGSPAAHRVDRDRFGSVSLCLGGSGAPLPRGEHTFELRYTTTDRLIELYDQDRFFLDITGSDLTIPIRRASASVHLPKGADTVRADGYAGLRNRKYFTTELMETADGDVIAYSVTRPLRPGGVFAVAINLRKGVVRPTLWQKIRHLDWEAGRTLSSLAVFMAGLGAAFVYFLIAWYRVGRDPRRGVVVPLYEPPAGTSPAFVRYLTSRRRVDDRSMVATLVRLAECGALTIREREGRYRIDMTGGHPTGCERHETEFLRALFEGATQIAFGTGQARARLRSARRTLERALRAEGRKLVPANVRYLWPGLALSLAGAAGAILVGPNLPIDGWIYLGLLAAGIAVLNLPFAVLLKAPTRHARKLFDDIEGFRRFLEASYKGAAVVPAGGPGVTEAHLPYAIAFGIDVERISILNRRHGWYGGQSGGFSVSDFTGAFGRTTPGAMKAC